MVVDTQEDHLPKDAVGAAGPGHPLVEAHRPVHPLHTADPVDGAVGDRLDLVGILLVAVGDPHTRLADIPEGIGSPAHEAHEDRGLLGDEEHPEGDAEHGAEILGGVAVEHLPSDPVHRGTDFLPPAEGAPAGRGNDGPLGHVPAASIRLREPAVGGFVVGNPADGRVVLDCEARPVGDIPEKDRLGERSGVGKIAPRP